MAPPNIPADANVQEAIARIFKAPGWEYLVGAVKSARARYFTNLAEGLGTQLAPVDQREIDEKRGFWQGAVWAIETLPKLTAKEYERFVEQALKESESA